MADERLKQYEHFKSMVLKGGISFPKRSPLMSDMIDQIERFAAKGDLADAMRLTCTLRPPGSIPSSPPDGIVVDMGIRKDSEACYIVDETRSSIVRNNDR